MRSSTFASESHHLEHIAKLQERRFIDQTSSPYQPIQTEGHLAQCPYCLQTV